MSDINEVRERLERACIAGMDAEYVNDVIALLDGHARLRDEVKELQCTPEQEDVQSYWRVSFRMYEDDTDLCVLFVDGPAVPNLDTLGVTPRPFELVSVELRHTKQHRWDAYGERCLDCGDKDWMNYQKCRPVYDTAKAVQP